MPIEPASVSKLVVREVEKTSGGATGDLWNSMQGSSTGGKDRPLQTLWDKAITGAQKLFGSQKSAEDPSLEAEEREREESDEERGGDASLRDGLARFENRNFGGIGFSSFPGNAFSGVSNSRHSIDRDPDFQNSQKLSAPEPSREREGSTQRLERVDNQPPQQEVEDPNEADDEERAAVAKDRRSEVSGQVKTGSSPVAPSVANGFQSSTATTANQFAPVDSPATSSTDASTGLRPAVVATSTSDMATNATASRVVHSTNPEASTVQEVPAAQALTPVTSSRQATPSSAPHTTASGTQLEPQRQANPTNVSDSVKPVASAPSVAATAVNDEGNAAAVLVPAKSGESASADPARVAVKAEPGTGADEGLPLDANKAKEAISEGLKKTVEVAKPAVAQAKPQVSIQAGQTATSELREVAAKSESQSNANLRAPEQPSDQKEPVVQESSKKEFATTLHKSSTSRPTNADATVTTRATVEASVDEIKAAPQVQKGPLGGNGANIATSNRAAPSASGSVPSRGNGSLSAAQGISASAASGGVAGTPAAPTGGESGASHHGDSQNSAKQDFAATMSAASGSKGVEKQTLDTPQAFDVKTNATDGSRKSQAVSKTQTSSYVSKTADELKEVVATLTKSIDRLVSNRPGTMNMKINFDQGGSMTLRLSMEGGQISTSMQTDVAGLESAIKANWSELANDWNQKGVKLNAPQFHQGAGQQADSNGRSDSWNEFGQRSERHAAFQNEGGKGGNGAQGRGRGRAANTANGVGVDAAPSIRSQTNEGASDSSLKTYA